MSKFLRNILKQQLLIMSAVILLIAGCQPAVRFAQKESKSSVEKPAKSKERKEHETAVKEDENIPMSATQNELIREAKRWIGTPYCYGGESKVCTDCSGFIQSVFEKIAVKLPRTAEEQYEFCKPVSEDNAQPGDLVFFTNKTAVSHVGIYLGNNEFIHSSSSQGVVTQSLDDSYFKYKFLGYRRALRNEQISKYSKPY